MTPSHTQFIAMAGRNFVRMRMRHPALNRLPRDFLNHH